MKQLNLRFSHVAISGRSKEGEVNLNGQDAEIDKPFNEPIDRKRSIMINLCI